MKIDDYLDVCARGWRRGIDVRRFQPERVIAGQPEKFALQLDDLGRSEAVHLLVVKHLMELGITCAGKLTLAKLLFDERDSTFRALFVRENLLLSPCNHFVYLTTYLRATVVLWIACGRGGAAVNELQNISRYWNAVGRYTRNSIVLYSRNYRLTRICTEVLGFQKQRRGWPLYV